MDTSKEDPSVIDPNAPMSMEKIGAHVKLIREKAVAWLMEQVRANAIEVHKKDGKEKGRGSVCAWVTA